MKIFVLRYSASAGPVVLSVSNKASVALVGMSVLADPLAIGPRPANLKHQTFTYEAGYMHFAE